MRVACRRCGGVHEKGACPRGAARRKRGRTPLQAFRSTARWQRCAAEAMRLDGGTCVMCMELRGLVTFEGLECHHVVPLAECIGTELEDDPGNTSTLCGRCHEEAERGDVSRSKLLELTARHRSRFGDPPGVTDDSGASQG